MDATRTIMHVDLDAFFVAVEQARDPALRGKPVIVGGEPDSRGVVSTASYEARVYGVRSGMPLATARRLCPHAVFVRGDFQEYQRISQRFHRILRDFSPVVESGGLDEAFLDLTGCGAIVRSQCPEAAPANGPGQELSEATARLAGEAIRQRVQDELSLTASVGIASGKSLAKVASDAAKPDGLLVVPPGEEAAFLASRPVRDLPGLGPRAESELARAGVRTLGQLASMPPARLRALFGKWGPALGERARGIDPTPVGPGRVPARSISREHTYAKDIADVSALRSSLRSFAESVGADLRRAEKRARCVTLKLRFGDFTTITRSRTLERPTYSDDTLYREAAALLERTLSRDRRAVRLVGLAASQLTEEGVQLGLFEQREVRLEGLLRAIDRLRAKYGHGSLETGLTFFDRRARRPQREPGRRAAPSSPADASASPASGSEEER